MYKPLFDFWFEKVYILTRFHGPSSIKIIRTMEQNTTYIIDSAQGHLDIGRYRYILVRNGKMTVNTLVCGKAGDVSDDVLLTHYKQQRGTGSVELKGSGTVIIGKKGDLLTFRFHRMKTDSIETTPSKSDLTASLMHIYGQGGCGITSAPSMGARHGVIQKTWIAEDAGVL